MITEKDVYNYIFFPHLVDDEKKKNIIQSDDYADLLILYGEIKSGTEKTIQRDVKLNLAAKIKLYDYNRFFRLKKADEEKPKRRREWTVLAAASAEEKPAVIAKSFLDENNQFLIRVIKTGDITKIYSFSIDETEIQNFKLTVLPSHKEFFMKDNSAPLVLKEDIEFEEVHLELA